MAIRRTALGSTSPIDLLKEKARLCQSELFKLWKNHPDVLLIHLFYFDKDEAYVELKDKYKLYHNHYKIETFINQFHQYQTVKALQDDFEELRQQWIDTCSKHKMDPTFREGFVVYVKVLEAHFIATFLKELTLPLTSVQKPLPHEYDVEALAKEYLPVLMNQLETHFLSECGVLKSAYDHEIIPLHNELASLNKKFKKIEDRKSVDSASEPSELVDQLIIEEYRFALDCKDLDKLKDRQDVLAEKKSAFMTRHKQQADTILSAEGDAKFAWQAVDVSHEFKELRLELKKINHDISIRKRKEALLQEVPVAQDVLTGLLKKDAKTSLQKSLEQYKNENRYNWNPLQAITNAYIDQTEVLLLKEYQALDETCKDITTAKATLKSEGEELSAEALSEYKKQIEDQLQQSESRLHDAIHQQMFEFRTKLIESYRQALSQSALVHDQQTALPVFMPESILTPRRLALDQRWKSILATMEKASVTWLVKQSLKAYTASLKQKAMENPKAIEHLLIFRDVKKRLTARIAQYHEQVKQSDEHPLPASPPCHSEPAIPVDNPVVLELQEPKSIELTRSAIVSDVPSPPEQPRSTQTFSIGRMLFSGVVMAVLAVCVAYFLAVPLVATLAIAGISLVVGAAGYAIGHSLYQCYQRPVSIPSHLRELSNQATEDMMMVSTTRRLHALSGSSLRVDRSMQVSESEISCVTAEISRSSLWQPTTTVEDGLGIQEHPVDHATLSIK